MSVARLDADAGSGGREMSVAAVMDGGCHATSYAMTCGGLPRSSARAAFRVCLNPG